ncbi:MAG: hypothetical protein LWW76_01460 [Burkholderiales bacterium]|nr:hypothetical protein [Burkholderiales bacterium]
MNDQTHLSTPKNSQNGNLALNIGIGMLLGLIIALIVAYFAMSSGPFRDRSNKNILNTQQGNTDPNAPLYTNSSSPPTIPSNTTPANEQGAGIGVLTNPNTPMAAPDGQARTTTATEPTNPLNATQTPPKTSTVITPTPDKKTGDSDAIGDLINNKGKPTKSTTNTPNASNNVTKRSVAPKEVTPTTANNTSN